MATAGQPRNIPICFATLLLIWYSSFRISVLIAGGEPRILTGVFWVFVYVAMSVAPFAQADLSLFPGLADPDTLMAATVVVFAGCLAYDVGSHSAGGTRWRDRPAPTAGGRVVTLARVKAVAAVGLAASSYYVVSLGGIAPFFSSRRDLAASFAAAGLRRDSQVGSALLTTLGTVPVLVAWLGLTCLIRREPAHRKPATAAGWTVLLLANAVVNNPISNPRYWFLTVFIGAMWAFPGLGARRYRTALITGSVLALLVFPYADYFRTDSAQRRPLTLASPAQTLATKDYDQMTMTADTIWWVRDNGYTKGRQALGSVFFWVPRSFWPGKPSDTGVLVGRALGGPNDNLSSPIWAELWVDFGILGVLAGLGLAGRLSARLDDAFLAALDGGRTEVLAADIGFPLLAGYEFIVLRGPLLQAMSRMVMIGFFILIVSESRSASADRGRGSRPLAGAGPGVSRGVSRAGLDGLSRKG
jgi:hypothetical protein